MILNRIVAAVIFAGSAIVLTSLALGHVNVNASMDMQHGARAMSSSPSSICQVLCGAMHAAERAATPLRHIVPELDPAPPLFSGSVLLYTEFVGIVLMLYLSNRHSKVPLYEMHSLLRI